MRGRAPYEIELHWVYGPPLPVGLTAEARHVMIAECIAQIFGDLLPTSPMPARAHTRPTRDNGPVGVT